MATCRITNLTLNFQEVQAEYLAKKMLKRYERSRYLYENKQDLDNKSGGKSDIYVAMTRFLQIFEPCDSNLPLQFGLSQVFSCIIQPGLDASIAVDRSQTAVLGVRDRLRADWMPALRRVRPAVLS